MSLFRLVRPLQQITSGTRLVLAANFSTSSPRDQTELKGLWHNELGSTMMIESAENGMLTGWYNTKVGDAKRKYVLTGRYDHVEGRRSLGWTVTWVNKYYSNSRSTTSWSGQYQLDLSGDEPHIITTWLLTNETKPKDDWNSTHVGQDVFTRVCPTAEVILKTKMQVRCSHPPEAEVE